MYYFSVGSGYCFHYGFGDGWVWVYCFQDFVPCGFELPCYYGFGNHIGYAVAHHMASEPFAIFGIKYYFNKSIYITISSGFSRSGEWEFTYFNLISFFFCLLFCKPYRSYFWVAEGTARDISVVDRLYA